MADRGRERHLPLLVLVPVGDRRGALDRAQAVGRAGLEEHRLDEVFPVPGARRRRSGSCSARTAARVGEFTDLSAPSREDAGMHPTLRRARPTDADAVAEVLAARAEAMSYPICTPTTRSGPGSLTSFPKSRSSRRGRRPAGGFRGPGRRRARPPVRPSGLPGSGIGDALLARADQGGRPAFDCGSSSETPALDGSTATWAACRGADGWAWKRRARARRRSTSGYPASR